MKTLKLCSAVVFLTLCFSGCGGGGGSDSGGVSADNGGNVIIGDCNIITGKTNNTCSPKPDDEMDLARNCRTCCDLCEGSAGVDGICRQQCVDDLGCQNVIDDAPSCAAVSDSDDTSDDNTSTTIPGIINPAVS